MKEILVDLYKIKDVYSGLGQFSKNFATELVSRLSADLKIDFLVPNQEVIDLETPNVRRVNANFQKRYLPVFNKKYDVWHSLHQFPSHFPNKNTKLLLTIHDLNFIVEKGKAKTLKYLARLQKNVDKAHCITTISNYSKEQIEKHLKLKGKEVHVIYNGIPPNAHDILSKPSFVHGGKFFFSIGIFSKKKNFEVLLPLMNHFKDYHLIIAGNKETAYGKQIIEEIERLNLKDSVVLPGKVSDADKAWLYANCEALLFPSLAEGFGMPAIEAMMEGKPVFLSKHTSLPEIGGEAAFYFNDFEEKNMVSLIKNKLQSVNENKELFSIKTKEYAKKFNWENCIKQYLALYQQIIND